MNDTAVLAMMEAVRKTLAGTRFSFRDEKEFQSSIAAILFLSEIFFVREYPLPPNGFVDFFLPGTGVAIEAKIKGSRPAVLRQISGYCEHPDVNGIVVVSTKARLAESLPEELCGKLVAGVPLWANGI